MEELLTITADREDFCVGLTGLYQANSFSGSGEGWHNNSDALGFCRELEALSENMVGEANLIGAEGKIYTDEYLETFSLRAKPVDKSKLNGTISIHVTLGKRPYSDCRPEEIYIMSGELKIRNHHVAKFAQELSSLIKGTVNEVCLYGGNNI
jgi:hypothetical protein